MSDRARERPSTPAIPPPRPWEGEIERHVRAYRAGGERDVHGAWLVRRLAPAVAAVFLNQETPREQARDLTQAVLGRVFEKVEEYRFEAPFSAWVRRIAVNHLRNTRRDERTRRRRLQEEPLEILADPADAAPSPLPHPALRQEPEAEAAAERSELRRALAAALGELPPGKRRCLLLFAQGFTYQEIADLLGVKLNTVRSQISNGYRRLRSLLAPYAGDGSGDRRDNLRGGQHGA